LEPSAGLGAIVNAIHGFTQRGEDVTCVEIDEHRVARLRERFAGHPVYHADFLTLAPALQFGRVVMNPPFAKQADIDHVLHAHRWLKPGGRLVSVMSAGVLFRENRKTVDFREFVAAHRGRFVDLPEGAFRESGTDVRTCYVVMEGSSS
jgi:16S rRNA G1207 methylase RsmC